MPNKKSVAPKGKTLPNSARRLDDLDEHLRAKDAEHIITQLWEDENVRSGNMNFGLVPVDVILHECSEKCKSEKERLLALVKSGGHVYNPEPNERDVQVVAATIQWLATNVGRCFLHKFLREFEEANSNKTSPK